ncbi:hypothetical protein AVEN_80150-1 [Araneus ventricosus]|uniref:Uncharacterized protein n=1 Tax=Araneus ventricosus TaxID=182803 RepID=A0A4Y2LQ75_ARAVE|nr:hypothetical protein AVEN_80150-1 [Araneus ventricosus]
MNTRLVIHPLQSISNRTKSLLKRRSIYMAQKRHYRNIFSQWLETENRLELPSEPRPMIYGPTSGLLNSATTTPLFQTELTALLEAVIHLICQTTITLTLHVDMGRQNYHGQFQSTYRATKKSFNPPYKSRIYAGLKRRQYRQ